MFFDHFIVMHVFVCLLLNVHVLFLVMLFSHLTMQIAWSYMHLKSCLTILLMYSATRFLCCCWNGDGKTKAWVYKIYANGSAVEENVRKLASILCKWTFGQWSSRNLQWKLHLRCRCSSLLAVAQFKGTISIWLFWYEGYIFCLVLFFPFFIFIFEILINYYLG